MPGGGIEEDENIEDALNHEVMEYLTSKGNTVITKDPGVYYIENTDISTQIIVTKELFDVDLAYLKLLQIEHKNQGLLSNWINEYLINTKDPLYGIVMDVLAKSSLDKLVERIGIWEYQI